MIKNYIKNNIEVKAIQLREDNVIEVGNLINKYKGIKSEIENEKEFIENAKINGGLYKGFNLLRFGDYLVIEKDFATSNEYWGFCNKEEFEANHQQTDNFINLNKLKNYECFTKNANLEEQLTKVLEEQKEFLFEVVDLSVEKTEILKETEVLKNKDNIIAEGLDVITAMYNCLAMIGLSKEDFEKHIAKLERYKETKYKK